MNFSIIRFLSVLFVFLLSQNAFSCSCGGPDIAVMDEEAEAVFSGYLKSKRRFYSFTMNKFKFKNLKIYKGGYVEEVEFWSEKFSSSCGMNFDENIPYIVFLYRDGERLIAGRCSSWPVIDQYEEYTHNFYEFYSPKDKE